MAISEEWYDSGSAQVWQMERPLTLSPAGQVKPSNWECNREAAFVDLQRACHSAAECWWYKCYNGQGKMEQQDLSKGFSYVTL